MELDQYNIKEFQDGLDDILKNPWKKLVYIQDTIPTFPEENNTLDRTKHDLIKVVFVLKRFMIPYYYIIWHLCLNKVYFLKYILDVSSKDKDFVIMFNETSRLTSHEIYEAFISMSSNNASFLLDKIECPISIYSKLKEALTAGEESKFAEAIDGCNLSSILPAINFVLAIKSNTQMLESSEQRKEEVTDLDSELEKQIILEESELTEKYGVSPNSQLYKDTIDLYNDLFESLKEPDVFLDELLGNLYPSLFYQYCQMKEDGCLNKSDIKAFEYIFHQPAFKEQYERCVKLWETGELESMFTKRSEEDSLNEDGGKEVVDSGAANKKEQQTQQIEEPATVEPHLEQLSAADYGQIIPSKLSEKQRKIIDDFEIRSNYFDDKPNDSDDKPNDSDDKPNDPDKHCTITNEKFNAIDAVKKAKMFENFIKLLAREYCIAPDKTTMKSCAYAFTGIGFKAYRGFHVQPVYWNEKKVGTLLFICTKFYKRNEDTSTNFQKAVEVFHVTADGNLSTRAKSIKGTRFDTKFKECFGEL